MQKDDTVYLRHILDASARIKEYVEGVSEERFAESSRFQDAVVRQLEIIGEATRNHSVEFRNAGRGIAWEQIVGLRNRIVHDHVNVDVQIVWEIVQNDLPVLRQHVERALRASRSDGR